MKENDNIEIQKEAPNCAELIKELTKYKEEGCALYKEKKIEEAKAKFKEGFDKFEKESAKISKESSNNEEYKEIIILGKKLLSNLALCYYSTINPIILLCAGAKLGTTDKKETDR
jgi:hypothetical protein